MQRHLRAWLPLDDRPVALSGAQSVSSALRLKKIKLRIADKMHEIVGGCRVVENTVLANTVSAYATLLAGLVALALTALMGKQPRRWLFAYLCVFITGVPTVWYHGFGETSSLASSTSARICCWAGR